MPLPTIASATPATRLSLPELVHTANLIVLGRCTNRESKTENGITWSFAEFRIMEVL